VRVWLYDTLHNAPALQGYYNNLPLVNLDVFPRESLHDTVQRKPFIVYGLGNDTNEQLSEDKNHKAHRQFFQVWIHDDGGDYTRIDDLVEIVVNLLQGQAAPSYDITNVHWLETSQEFSDQTFNTLFRYIRFQAIISKGALT